jgi:Nucleoside 2-deoxyribosyltransferase like
MTVFLPGKPKTKRKTMNILHADQPLKIQQPSIFLVGPTPRRKEVGSWRPDALEILRRLGFAGTVLAPERRDWTTRFAYSDQVEWEFAGLESCTIIAFWVPRDLGTLPGFTTNVEFGRYVGSGRCVYGRPENAPHTSYLDWLYEKLARRKPESSLEATMKGAMEATR